MPSISREILLVFNQKWLKHIWRKNYKSGPKCEYDFESYHSLSHVRILKMTLGCLIFEKVYNRILGQKRILVIMSFNTIILLMK